MTTYTAGLKKVGRFWKVYVRELDRTTQVVRLSEVEDAVRDLVNLLTDEPKSSIMVDRNFILADSLRRRIDEARTRRAEAEALAKKASADMRQAARQLRAEGYTVRDVGEVLNLSYQRAQQLSAAESVKATAHRRKYDPNAEYGNRVR